MADLAAFRSEMRRQAEDLASRVMASDAGQRLLGVYDQLGERDRMALRGLSWFAAAVLVYLAAISPLVAHVDSALRRLESEQALLSWLKSHDPAATGTSTVIAQRDEPLATMINATAEEGGLAIRRYEPSGEDGVRVWMEGASFNAFVKWLYVLEGTHGIRAAEFNIERENEPGKVSVRITLRG